MRRTTKAIVALSAAATFALTGCGSQQGAATAEEAQPASIGYVRLPDGRVLTCVHSVASGPNEVYTCDWSRPFSTNGTAPAEAKVSIIERFEYFTVPNGKTLQCISFFTHGPNRVTECDWNHPVEQR